MQPADDAPAPARGRRVLPLPRRAGGQRLRRVILTADDFGASLAVNEAVERAHRDGVLSAASLMVGGAEAADAVLRARRLPALRVGLHLVLARGRALLPAERIPDLVGGDGRFREDLLRAGVTYFFRRGVRRQLEAEMRTQFEAFRRTGLPLDHVNAHNHLHLHPTILGLVIRIGRDYGLGAVRVPDEPPLAAWRAGGGKLAARLLFAATLAPWTAWMRRRLRRAGLYANDHLFGLFDSGRMTAERVLALLRVLPAGTTELHFHAAAGAWHEPGPAGAGYRCREELEALLSPGVRAALHEAGLRATGFDALAAPAAGDPLSAGAAGRALR